jgi:dsRNA-specific ribonuclease
VFTHSSWAPDRTSSYERLEFLGDSVLELAVARALYERYPDFTEGRMAKIRSHVVSRASCSVVARELGLGQRLAERGEEIAPAEELERLSRNRNVLAALLEAALPGPKAADQRLLAAKAALNFDPGRLRDRRGRRAVVPHGPGGGLPRRRRGLRRAAARSGQRPAAVP